MENSTHPITKAFTDSMVFSDHYYKLCNESPHYIPTQFTYLGNKKLIVIKMCKLCFINKNIGTPVLWEIVNENIQCMSSVKISNVNFEKHGEICEDCLKKQNFKN